MIASKDFLTEFEKEQKILDIGLKQSRLNKNERLNKKKIPYNIRGKSNEKKDDKKS
tara:strand:- start:778 stop:945 length:168 start_codon:yes stop_codon:yes gene_type:complete